MINHNGSSVVDYLLIYGSSVVDYLLIYGSSVVDYLLLMIILIAFLPVGDLTEFSKHVPVTFNVKHGLDIELRNINSSHKYIKLSCDKKEEYTHTLENHLIQLRNIVNQTNSTDCDIDSVIKDFTDVLYDASFSVFGKEC